MRQTKRCLTPRLPKILPILTNRTKSDRSDSRKTRLSCPIVRAQACNKCQFVAFSQRFYLTRSQRRSDSSGTVMGLVFADEVFRAGTNGAPNVGDLADLR